LRRSATRARCWSRVSLLLGFCWVAVALESADQAPGRSLPCARHRPPSPHCL
jgi:hypothetical protein